MCLCQLALGNCGEAGMGTEAGHINYKTQRPFSSQASSSKSESCLGCAPVAHWPFLHPAALGAGEAFPERWP